MLRFEVYEWIVGVLGCFTVIDYCTDPLGTNLLTVGYFEVFVNSLMRKNPIKGKKGVINPPFCNAETCIKLAE